ncbi:hypothetical protein AVEN_197603-1 [Araneus ventricosus]|uniref:Uncharacterized protein n=1 Tax=Araneus ventricosus TaxID=182803 RepID=A0A4Y2QAY2_ARAVE|nr:hypothetical protein AVEN_197603-1 [Araneus ventricosus]
MDLRRNVGTNRTTDSFSFVPTACGLAKPRGLYLWTVVDGIRTVAPFQRRVTLQISPQRSSKHESNTESAGEFAASSSVSEQPSLPEPTEELVSCETL